MIIHKYLVNNDLRSHIEKIVQLYKTQAETMLNAIAKYFPTYVNYTKPDGGMFIWVTLPEGTSSLDLFYKAMEEKVAFVPGDPFYTNKSNVNTFRLNYTNTSPEIIEEGIKRLGNILYSLSSEKQTV